MQAPISISGVNVTTQFFTVKYLVNGSLCDSKMIGLDSLACVDDAVCTVTSTTSNCNSDNNYY